MNMQLSKVQYLQFWFKKNMKWASLLYYVSVGFIQAYIQTF